MTGRTSVRSVDDRRVVMLSSARELLVAAGDLLLGAVCPGCRRPGLGLCAQCRTRVATAADARGRLTRPQPCPRGFPVAVSSAEYADPFRSMIIAHKEDGALLLAPTLGRLLAGAVLELMVLTGAEQQPVSLVAMPSSAVAVRRRGYDAVETMSRHAVGVLRRSGYDVSRGPRLRQRRRMRDQAGLDATQRHANLAGGLRLARGIRTDRERWLVLADDVVTTGSTLTEATAVLRHTGFRVLGAATVAATIRRGPGSAAVRT